MSNVRAHMSIPRNLVVALLAGFALAWLTVFVAGWLAAIQLPHSFFAAVKGHPDIGYLVHTTLLVQVSMALLALLAGWLLFRLLNQASLPLVLACAAPWFAFCTWESVRYFAEAELPAEVKLRLLLDWRALPGLLSVPVGLWLASKLPTNNAP